MVKPLFPHNRTFFVWQIAYDDFTLTFDKLQKITKNVTKLIVKVVASSQLISMVFFSSRSTRTIVLCRFCGFHTNINRNCTETTRWFSFSSSIKCVVNVIYAWWLQVLPLLVENIRRMFRVWRELFLDTRDRLSRQKKIIKMECGNFIEKYYKIAKLPDLYLSRRSAYFAIVVFVIITTTKNDIKFCSWCLYCRRI